jgi:hypothetical protein
MLAEGTEMVESEGIVGGSAGMFSLKGIDKRVELFGCTCMRHASITLVGQGAGTADNALAMEPQLIC